MVRAAAKNHADGGAWSTSAGVRRRAGRARRRRLHPRRSGSALAAEAFAAHRGLRRGRGRRGSPACSRRPTTGGRLPGLGLRTRRAAVLRYGENPHQRAALYLAPARAGLAAGRAAARQGDVLQQLRRRRRRLAGGLRLRRALRSRSSSTPTRAASRSAADVAEAHRKAHACDPVSAFGGVIAVNRPVTVELAEQIADDLHRGGRRPGLRRRRGRGARRPRRTSGCSRCPRLRSRRRSSSGRSPAACWCRRRTGSTPPATTRRPGRWPPATPADAATAAPTWSSPGGRCRR